jgi:thiamine pyrophosphate-dependent acetolactate synthase large subunit-like protein
MARTVADQVVGTLEAAGVKRIYGLVGDIIWRDVACDRQQFLRVEL